MSKKSKGAYMWMDEQAGVYPTLGKGKV